MKNKCVILYEAEVIDALLSQLRDDIGTIVRLTYLELLGMVTQSELTPGVTYVITDYTCTPDSSKASSAGNVFGIAVKAISNNTLSEVASAIPVAGTPTELAVNMSAWKLRYSISNNSTRFPLCDAGVNGSDAPTGKGWIYYMEDENRNVAPFDFKNIKWSRNSKSYYTFSDIELTSEISGYSEGSISDLSLNPVCHDNYIGDGSSDVILSNWDTHQIHDIKIGTNSSKIYINSDVVYVDNSTPATYLELSQISIGDNVQGISICPQNTSDVTKYLHDIQIESDIQPASGDVAISASKSIAHCRFLSGIESFTISDDAEYLTVGPGAVTSIPSGTSGTSASRLLINVSEPTQYTPPASEEA